MSDTEGRAIGHRVPILTSACEDDRHRICGGWWCVCPCHDDTNIVGESQIRAHVEHEWKQIGPCVYCEPCDVRLYQGRIGTEAGSADREAIAALMDAVHNKAVIDWAAMRVEVEEVRRGA